MPSKPRPKKKAVTKPVEAEVAEVTELEDDSSGPSDMSIVIERAVQVTIDMPESLYETLAEIADFRSMDIPHLVLELCSKDSFVQSRWTKASIRSWARNR